MIKKPLASRYGESFEADRRLRPRLWNADYCLLVGLVGEIKRFVAKHVTPSMTVLDFGDLRTRIFFFQDDP